MNLNIYRAVFSACIVAAFLSACATKPDTTELLPTQTIAEREAALKAFKPWRALGSITLESVQEGKFNANYSWDASDQGFDIKLFGPLGIRLVHLSEDDNGAQLTDRERTIRGRDASTLLASILGFDVPVKQMQDWAVGLPGDAQQLNRDDQGRLDDMVVVDNNTSWQVDFRQYTVIDNMYLPKSVFIQGEGVTIKLSFEKWSRGKPVDSGRLSIPGVDT